MQPKYLILYVGSKESSAGLEERLGILYRVEPRANSMELLGSLSGMDQSPNMIICDTVTLWSKFDSYTEFVDLARDGNPSLPIILLDNTRSGAILASLGSNVWYLVSNELDTLVKHVTDVLATKH